MTGALVRDLVDGTAQWARFSASELFADRVEPLWEARKARGNALFAAGDYAGASALYEEAALVAAGPNANGAGDAFRAALAAWPEGSAAKRVADAEDVVRRVLGFGATYPLDRETHAGRTVRAPNFAVAVARANKSAALLRAGDAAAALEQARLATAADPAYVKGHRREAAALLALGRAAEAREAREALAAYARARGALPSEALALVLVDWIDWDRALYVYGPIRFDVAAEHVAASLGRAQLPPRVEVRASLVPFYGGQCLMLSLRYGASGVVDCMDWVMVDGRNADIADAPPNGVASPAALRHAPMRIGVFISELAGWDLEAVAVMCGQGLVDHVGLVRDRLAAGHETMHEPFPDLVVYRAATTAASEDSGALPHFELENHDLALRARDARGVSPFDGLGALLDAGAA